MKVSETTRIQVRTSRQLKNAASETLQRMGLDMTSAINMYLQQIVNRQELPFIPTSMDANAQARWEAEHHSGKAFTSVDALMRELDTDD